MIYSDKICFIAIVIRCNMCFSTIKVLWRGDFHDNVVCAEHCYTRAIARTHCTVFFFVDTHLLYHFERTWCAFAIRAHIAILIERMSYREKLRVSALSLILRQQWKEEESYTSGKKNARKRIFTWDCNYKKNLFLLYSLLRCIFRGSCALQDQAIQFSF